MLISVEKILMSVELMRFAMWSIYFLDFLYVRYNCAKFHYSRICVTNFRNGLSFWPPYPWVAPKRPIQNRVKDFFSKCAENPSFLWICLHLLKKSLMEIQGYSKVVIARTWIGRRKIVCNNQEKLKLIQSEFWNL